MRNAIKNVKLWTVALPFFIFFSGLGLIQAQGPRQIEDQLGRVVQVPQNPQRIISLAPSITEFLYALGKEKRLVGVTRFSDTPKEAASLEKVGSYINLDLEKILSLGPDLCLATKDGNPIEAVNRLEELGVPVYALDPRRMEAIMQTALELGNLLGAEKEAGKLVQDLEQRIKRVQKKVSQVKKRPRVFFQIGISPIVSVGTNTFIHELISMAGGINLAAGKADYPRFSREDVLMLQPEVILINSMNRDSKALEETKEMWKGYKELPAARKGKIYAVDADLFNRPGPKVAQALELLFRLIHSNKS